MAESSFGAFANFSSSKSVAWRLEPSLGTLVCMNNQLVLRWRRSKLHEGLDLLTVQAFQ